MKKEIDIPALEDIRFKYERLTALISCLQILTAECIDVFGIQEDCLSYSLYEIETELRKNNEELGKLISEA